MKFIYTVPIKDFGLLLKDRERAESDGLASHKLSFESLLASLLGSKYPEGIKGQTSRRYDDICRKIDKTETEVIELDKSELDLLKELFGDDHPPIHTYQNRYFNSLRRNFEETFEKSKQEKEEK